MQISIPKAKELFSWNAIKQDVAKELRYRVTNNSGLASQNIFSYLFPLTFMAISYRYL